MSTESAAAAPPILFVDLDGTLIRTDTLQEALVLFAKDAPGRLWRAPLWMRQGLGKFKQETFRQASPGVETLPYRPDVLEFLREQKAMGRRLVLATATDRKAAEAVALHLGDLFEAVIATDGGVNLKGAAKLAAMKEYCAARGLTSFGYAGDSSADLPIWEAADEIVAVAPSSKVRRKLASWKRPVRLFPREHSRPKSILKLVRVKQWAKNLLVFVPMFLAHEYTQPAKIFAAMLAFAAFSLIASAVYIVNDLLDVEADRIHPKKKHRPLASGAVSAATAIPLAAGCLGGGLLLSFMFLPLSFFGAVALYAFLTTAYSTWWKQIAIFDVIVLASLYALRVSAGGLATSTEVSEWLIGFSVFIFTSLAFIKRYSELARLASEGKGKAQGRGYTVDDLGFVGQCGVTSGYMAVLVFALYISESKNVAKLYNPIPLWFISLFLLYWVSKLWLAAHRRILMEDPVIYALTNRGSLFVAVLTLGMVAFARWLGPHPAAPPHPAPAAPAAVGTAAAEGTKTALRNPSAGRFQFAASQGSP